jgi:8-oxo-dGTP pyrophosphatase MutT (NUDIX family)
MAETGSPLTTAALVARARARLAGHERRVVPPGTLVPAAVLLPIVDHAGEPYVLFTKRTSRVGHHKGQISFPGGVVDPEDGSFLAAALRECEEEIALPRHAVEPLGTLDDTETFATSFVITPIVGAVWRPVAWQPDGEEIEKVIEVPFDLLAAEGSCRVEHWERDGVTRPVYFFDYEGETIWGATARILVGFLELLRRPA